MPDDLKSQILTALVTALVAILTAATPLVVHALVVYLRRKLSIAITDHQEQSLRDAAMTGVSWVEEQARKGSVLAGPDKLRMATEVARDALRRQGHLDFERGLTDFVMRQAVEVALAATRPLPVSGEAAVDVRVSATPPRLPGA